MRLRERSCAQRSLSSVKHGGSPCSDFLSYLKSSMAFACAQGGIRCSFQLSWLNSKVSADVTARLLSSAEPFHTQVDHRPFNSSTHDSHRSSNSFRGYFVCRASLSRISCRASLVCRASLSRISCQNPPAVAAGRSQLRATAVSQLAIAVRASAGWDCLDIGPSWSKFSVLACSGCPAQSGTASRRRRWMTTVPTSQAHRQPEKCIWPSN